MFARPNPYEDIVEKATNENLTSENWELILNICEKVQRGPPDAARDVIAAIQKRLTSRNANVQLYSLALTDALIKNCDTTVAREVSGRSFTNTLAKIATDKTVHESVRRRDLELIQQWTFDFTQDPSLGIMGEMMDQLQKQGVVFPSPQKPKKEATQSELERQKEEEELQLALALSLSESESRPSYKAGHIGSTCIDNSSYFFLQATTSTPSATQQQKATGTTKEAPREIKSSRVRCLYDFTPTEPGEMEFKRGDIIKVIESVYRDWWKGELNGTVGIFPVNYVEPIPDPSPEEMAKEVQMEADVMAEVASIDKLLDLLRTMDPRRENFAENEQLQDLYNRAISMRPKLVKLIEKYSQKKNDLIDINEKFMRARSTYDKLLESSVARYSAPGPSDQYGYPAHDTQRPPPDYGYGHAQPYSSNLPPYYT